MGKELPNRIIMTNPYPYRVPVEVSSSDSGRTWRTWLLERLTFLRFARKALGGHWEREIYYDTDRGRSRWTKWRQLESCSNPNVSAVASWPLHCEGPLRTFVEPEKAHLISFVGKDGMPLENGDFYVERVGGRISAWVPQGYKLLGRVR
jgi:hypothetical protein